MTVRQGVLLIEKTPGDQVKPAYVRVLGVHSKDQDIALLAPAAGKGLVQVEHGGCGLNAGNLLLDCAHIIHRQVIAHRLDTCIRQPGVLGPDQGWCRCSEWR